MSSLPVSHHFPFSSQRRDASQKAKSEQRLRQHSKSPDTNQLNSQDKHCQHLTWRVKGWRVEIHGGAAGGHARVHVGWHHHPARVEAEHLRVRRVERPLGMGVRRGRIHLLLPVLHLVQLLLQGTGWAIAHGCGASNHTDVLVSQRKTRAIIRGSISDEMGGWGRQG